MSAKMHPRSVIDCDDPGCTKAFSAQGTIVQVRKRAAAIGWTHVKEPRGWPGFDYCPAHSKEKP